MNVVEGLDLKSIGLFALSGLTIAGLAYTRAEMAKMKERISDLENDVYGDLQSQIRNNSIAIGDLYLRVAPPPGFVRREDL